MLSKFSTFSRTLKAAIWLVVMVTPLQVFAEDLQFSSVSQSSTIAGAVATRAADGNTSGVWSEGSVTATALEAQPWWTGDLGGITNITSVQLFNRTDASINRLSNVYVHTSSTPFSSTSLSVTLADTSVTSVFHAGVVNGSVTLPINAPGRYVRVQLQGSNYLSLAEVKVDGDPLQGPETPLLTFVSVSQSSTVAGAVATRAADGNTSGIWSEGSVTATNLQAQPWWTGDLGGTANISSVHLFNRTDASISRLSNVYVHISSAPFSTDSLSDTLADSAITSVFHAGVVNGSVSLPVAIAGRYVRVQLQGSNYLSLAEVQVRGELVDSPEATLLPFVSVSQSSTIAGAVATRAADGNTSGIWSEGSVTATNLQAQPWWTGDLGGTANISSVHLFNRTDASISRLSNVYVHISSTPFSTDSLSDTLADSAITSVFHAGVVNGSVSLPVAIAGRYVRVQLQGSNYLSLAEVQVRGELVDSPEATLLPFVSVSQSSTIAGAVATRAADGNTSGIWSEGSVTATNLEAQPWWTGDLGGIADIISVQLFNRTDASVNRLSNVYVHVSSEPFTTGNLSATLADAAVTSVFHAGVVNGSVTLPVNSPGRYVRVQLQGSNYLSLAEVQVRGDPVPVVPDIDLADYEQVFAEEFSGASLDPAKWDTGLLWGPYLPINNEKQLYVDSLGMHSSLGYSPFELTGSTLKITASAVSNNLPVPDRPPVDSPLWNPRPYSEYRFNPTVGNPGDEDYEPGFQSSDVDYLSGIITSYGSFNLSHGYVETRAKIPAGRGLWPAFWLLPIHYVEDVPEIDVMEFLGQDVDRVYHTYHYFNVPNNWQLISTPSFTTLASDWTQEFHTYGMAWSPREIVWYVDGVETRRITDSEYRIANQAMYLIANLAVGGNWPGDPDASTVFPATYEIDYIRAYKKKLSPTLNLAQDYQLMFEDEFTGTTLDSDKWNTHFLWGPYLPINNEEQYYVDALGSDAGGASPFSISNGVLSITARAADDPAGFPIPQTLPTPDDDTWHQFPTFHKNENYSPGNYTSGIITSYDSFKFAYGYAEIRARIPKGDGLWPAFWLLNGYYVSQQPEIDIMEVRGENPHQIVHSYYRSNNGVPESTSFTTDGGNLPLGYSDDFHTYGVRWRPGSIVWYIDGQPVHTYTDTDVGYQLMYLIVNLAVGGDFNFSEVDPTLFPTSLDIDYIRVYQEKDTE